MWRWMVALGWVGCGGSPEVEIPTFPSPSDGGAVSVTDDPVTDTTDTYYYGVYREISIRHQSVFQTPFDKRVDTFSKRFKTF